MKTILAAPDLLKIEKISFCSDEVRLVLKTRLLRSTCPSCGRQSDKSHSRYRQHLADLPWEGVSVKLILSVRKFFCLNPDCRRRIFCERLPGMAAPYAHKTLRLNELLTRLGGALGSSPGARLAFGMEVKATFASRIGARITRLEMPMIKPDNFRSRAVRSGDSPVTGSLPL